MLSANNGNDDSKVNVGVSGSLLNLTWEADDVIAVSGGASGELHLTGGAGTANATFEGDITLNRAGDIVFSVGSENCMGQTGTIDGLKSIIYLVGTSEYIADGNYDVTMELRYAVLKLDLSTFADDTKGEGVTVTITSDDAPLASVAGITSASKAVYVALPADGTENKKYTFSNGKGMNAEMTWTLAANTFYTKIGSTTGDAIVIEAGPVEPSATIIVDYNKSSPFRLEITITDINYGVDNSAEIGVYASDNDGSLAYDTVVLDGNYSGKEYVRSVERKEIKYLRIYNHFHVYIKIGSTTFTSEWYDF